MSVFTIFGCECERYVSVGSIALRAVYKITEQRHIDRGSCRWLCTIRESGRGGALSYFSKESIKAVSERLKRRWLDAEKSCGRNCTGAMQGNEEQKQLA